MNTDKYQTRKDVINNKAHTTQKANAFCQIRYSNQSLFYNSISQLNNQISKSSTQITSILSNPFNPLINPLTFRNNSEKPTI